MIPPDVGMGGDSVNIVDEINMQRAIIQSLGIELDGSDAELAEAMRPPSPCPDFNIRPNSPVNTMEPIVEISTMEDAMNTSMLASMHASLNPPPMHTPMQSPMLRAQQIPPGTQTVAVMPFKNPDGKTALKLLPYKGEGRPSGEVVPGQGVQPAQLARALMPYAENRFPAHTGDGVYAGGSAQPYTLSKRQMTICFVLPWGTRYYARELHTDNTMQVCAYLICFYFDGLITTNHHVRIKHAPRHVLFGCIRDTSAIIVTYDHYYFRIYLIFCKVTCKNSKTLIGAEILLI